MALNPHQKNKVDISAMNEEEQKLFRLYGKLPTRKDLITKKLSNERKYFDSGDYAMSKAGKSEDGSLGGTLGREHPTPEGIPHLSQVQSASSQPGEHRGSMSEHRGSLSGGPSLVPTLSHGGSAGSPVKDPSILQRGMSVDEQDTEAVASAAGSDATGLAAADGAAETKGVPIRQ